MDTARREAVSRATRLAGNGPVLAKRRNKANDHFTPRPKGAPQVTWNKAQPAGNGMPFLRAATQCQVTWGALHPSILG